MLRPYDRLQPKPSMTVFKVRAALKRLKNLNTEIRYADCFAGKHFTSGLIVFRPSKKSDPKEINHVDKDVVCHVPKGTAHDFAAGKNGELVLFYSLVKS